MTPRLNYPPTPCKVCFGTRTELVVIGGYVYGRRCRNCKKK